MEKKLARGTGSALEAMVGLKVPALGDLKWQTLSTTCSS